MLLIDLINHAYNNNSTAVLFLHLQQQKRLGVPCTPPHYSWTWKRTRQQQLVIGGTRQETAYGKSLYSLMARLSLGSSVQDPHQRQQQ
jgi:hypothetical protein